MYSFHARIPELSDEVFPFSNCSASLSYNKSVTACFSTECSCVLCTLLENTFPVSIGEVRIRKRIFFIHVFGNNIIVSHQNLKRKKVAAVNIYLE